MIHAQSEGALRERSSDLILNQLRNLLESLLLDLIEVNMVCAEVTQCPEDITSIVEREANIAPNLLRLGRSDCVRIVFELGVLRDVMGVDRLAM